MTETEDAAEMLIDSEKDKDKEVEKEIHESPNREDKCLPSIGASGGIMIGWDNNKWRKIQDAVVDWEPNDIEIPFSEEEVHKAIFDMNGDKSPGPDGFSAIFFQVFWEVVKLDIMRLFEEFYEGKLEINRINYAHIILIQKKNEASTVNDYRPISLLNVIYKIITKVLTNRLNPKLEMLIDPMQSGFIKNRFLLDGVVAAQEIIDDCFQNNKKGGILLKLDFAKTYDMLDWNFILEVLKAKKIGEKWINWVNMCLNKGMSAIKINDKPGKWIMSKRGVRQGDPLSPLLFVLAADTFTRMLSLAVGSQLIEGLGPINMTHKVFCLQYADDTLIFCLKLNFNKSVLIALENNEDLQQNLATMLNCKSGKFPITYLGVPLRPGKLKKDDCSQVEVGEGNQTLFWLDKWLDSHTLAAIYPSLFVNTSFPFATVSSMRKKVNDTWRWDLQFKRQLTGTFVSQYFSLMNLLNSICLEQKEDKRKWLWDLKGDFTVKSYYLFLIDGGLRCDCADIWKLPIPLKVKFLVWLAFRHGLNTKDVLEKKGIQLEKICCLCSKLEESHTHLFIKCEFVYSIWRSILFKLKIEDGCNWNSLKEMWHNLKAGEIDNGKMKRDVFICSKKISARAIRLQERRRKRSADRMQAIGADRRQNRAMGDEVIQLE
ncbi:uncharacterized protein LOC109847206 [Asparagus officinalis]|uniref:uncharacterized protein LOC109847206 n=1 Tax=Asparagus officinalis TaxID=4686 RepID=UPI00098E5B86|nr:uncharacterized protein LOC109847206 [Asparagus officinalis]